MATFVIETYDYLNQRGDPRVNDWASVYSPNLVLTIIAIYLLSVYVFLPAFMKNRSPYSLKTFLFCYNICQIAYCIFLIRGFLNAGLKLTCQPVDYSAKKQALDMLHYFYYGHVLKGIELTETFVFILRKKYNQVTKLHVYHHASTFFLSWVGVKYVGGGMVAVPYCINSAIHILMYTYYLFASLGEEWQERTKKWKPKLTMFQMIQLGVLILHSLQVLHPECNFPKKLLLLFVPDVTVVLYMFWQFYKDSYKKPEKKE